ncbi:MAG: hypothetical protein F6K40_06640 [Okeania sp. SIO3I5]|uniref:hypothetical protein n=1 Tax=Okeania sp. SIO3I5 TaxID=2607805 RepID=UPI0013BABC1D|nr:hypothetical protein [Okeania sp. SIO3I5]NEQ35978.1 hypothetical protein [Okeania sp. SIO3I5]
MLYTQQKEIFPTHHPWRGASENELIIALYAIEGIFPIHHLWRGASENESIIALYAIEEKFPDSSPLAGCFRK